MVFNRGNGGAVEVPYQPAVKEPFFCVKALPFLGLEGAVRFSPCESFEDKLSLEEFSVVMLGTTLDRGPFARSTRASRASRPRTRHCVNSVRGVLRLFLDSSKSELTWYPKPPPQNGQSKTEAITP